MWIRSWLRFWHVPLKICGEHAWQEYVRLETWIGREGICDVLKICWQLWMEYVLIGICIFITWFVGPIWPTGTGPQLAAALLLRPSCGPPCPPHSRPYYDNVCVRLPTLSLHIYIYIYICIYIYIMFSIHIYVSTIWFYIYIYIYIYIHTYVSSVLFYWLHVFIEPVMCICIWYLVEWWTHPLCTFCRHHNRLSQRNKHQN